MLSGYVHHLCWTACSYWTEWFAWANMWSKCSLLSCFKGRFSPFTLKQHECCREPFLDCYHFACISYRNCRCFTHMLKNVNSNLLCSLGWNRVTTHGEWSKRQPDSKKFAFPFTSACIHKELTRTVQLAPNRVVCPHVEAANRSHVSQTQKAFSDVLSLISCHLYAIIFSSGDVTLLKSHRIIHGESNTPLHSWRLLHKDFLLTIEYRPYTKLTWKLNDVTLQWTLQLMAWSIWPNNSKKTVARSHKIKSVSPLISWLLLNSFHFWNLVSISCWTLSWFNFVSKTHNI